MATAEAVINSRREMKEKTNAAMMRLSLFDFHFESHVSMKFIIINMNIVGLENFTGKADRVILLILFTNSMFMSKWVGYILID